MYMIWYVANDLHQAKAMLELWVEAGVQGITLLEGIGLRQLIDKGELRDDLGLMPSLKSILRPHEVARPCLYSVVENAEDLQRITASTTAFVQDWTRPDVGVLFVWPILQAYGLNKVFEK